MAVDDLVRELGSVRRAVWELRASFAVKAALERAIADAAEAVESTTDGPANPGRLLAARDALGLAEQMILEIDARSRSHRPGLLAAGSANRRGQRVVMRLDE